MNILLALVAPFALMLFLGLYRGSRYAAFIDAKPYRIYIEVAFVVLVTALCWCYVARVTPPNPHPDTAFHLP